MLIQHTRRFFLAYTKKSCTFFCTIMMLYIDSRTIVCLWCHRKQLVNNRLKCGTSIKKWNMWYRNIWIESSLKTKCKLSPSDVCFNYQFLVTLYIKRFCIQRSRHWLCNTLYNSQSKQHGCKLTKGISYYLSHPNTAKEVWLLWLLLRVNKQTLSSNT